MSTLPSAFAEKLKERLLRLSREEVISHEDSMKSICTCYDNRSRKMLLRYKIVDVNYVKKTESRFNNK